MIRKCVACGKQFKPLAPEEWWCSEPCHRELKLLGERRQAERREAVVESREARGELDAESEAAKARRALSAPPPLPEVPRDRAIADALLRAVGSLCLVSVDVRDDPLAALPLRVARAYLEVATEILDAGLPDDDDAPAGPGLDRDGAPED